MLKNILERYSTDIDEPTKDELKLINERTKIMKDLEEQLTEEQQQLLEKYLDIESEVTYLREEKIFMFGYIMATQINKVINIMLGDKEDE